MRKNGIFCKKVMSLALCGVMVTGLVVTPAKSVKAESKDMIYGEPTTGGEERNIDLKEFSLSGSKILWPGDTIVSTPYSTDSFVFGTPHLCHDQDCDYYRGTTGNVDKNVTQHGRNQGLKFTIVGDCATVTKGMITVLSPNKPEHATEMEESQLEVDQKALITGTAPVKVVLLDSSSVSRIVDIECNKGYWSERYYMNTGYPVKIESLGSDYLKVNYNLDGGVLLGNDTLPDKFYFSSTGYTIENDVEPVKLGYTFRWWDEDQPYGLEVLDYKNKKSNSYLDKNVYIMSAMDAYRFDEAKKYVESGLDFTAYWVEARMSVTFDANGGKFPYSNSVTKTVSYTEEAGNDTTFMNQIPTKEGAEFLGWYIGDTKITKINDIPQSAWNSENDYTVTAKWEGGVTSEHKYGQPTFEWTGFTAAKATFICTNETNHKEVKDAAITSKVTKEATITEEGIKTYTATVVFDGKTYVDTKNETIPKLKDDSKSDTDKIDTSKPDTDKVDTSKPDTDQVDTSKVETPKKGDPVKDDKKTGDYAVVDATKKEVEYKAPANKKAKTVTIPATIKVNGVEYKVTKVSDKAFKGNKNVTKITVGSNVKTIGKEAFSGCKKLKTLKISSKSLTTKTVSKNAFKGVTKATTIKVPKKKLAEYKKIFKKKGLSSKVKVKGY